MPKVFITGAHGLVGSACVRHFSGLGWKVHGIDNNARAGFFGADGDTSQTQTKLKEDCPGVKLRKASICDFVLMKKFFRSIKPDLIIHAAAQPSHDYAASHPLEDFEMNARGTLNLLEAMRQECPQAVFVFLSTNKVYGDIPNRLEIIEKATRFDLVSTSEEEDSPPSLSVMDECMTIDQSLHSLFGCSKAAADLYTQEYGRNFGLKTVCLRCGCLTGGAHAGAEQHGFLAYLAKCCREDRSYKVYGYKGKQVRDQLHASDVARACEEFYQEPRCGEVYNLGGGRDNSISVMEAITEVEKRFGKKLAWEYVDEPRQGDHQVWISDTGKFREHYPDWSVRVSLAEILDEICGQLPQPQ